MLINICAILLSDCPAARFAIRWHNMSISRETVAANMSGVHRALQTVQV